MEMVESYLSEVGRFLPADTRSEVLDELRDAIIGEVDGRAEAAGRAPNAEDEKTVLAQFGHPLRVATRYQPEKYLIGPDLYPAFIQTLKVVFVVALVAQVVVALFVGQTNDWQIGPFGLLKMFFEMVVWIGAIVVLVFVSIEYSGERLHWYERWQPEALAKGSLGIIKRDDVIINLVSEGFFLLWWNNVVVLQNWLPVGPDQFYLSLSGVWSIYFWHLNLLFGALFLLHFYVLVRGVWHRRLLLAEIVGNTALLGVGLALLSAGALVEVTGTVGVMIVEKLQLTVKVSLVVVAGIAVWDIWGALSLFRGPRTT